MLKVCAEKWSENKDKLKEALRNDCKLNYCDYLYLVKKTVEIILNDGKNECVSDYNVEKIHEIDDGDYQGTLLFIIPRRTYQPAEYEYLMTYVGYGSCSGCDTLQAIQGWGDEPISEEGISDFTTLCLHLIQNIIKPYNYDWRDNEKFKPCEEEGRTNE